MENNYIEIIERLNLENIKLLNNERNFLKKINLKTVFSSFRKRFLFKNIKQKFAEENLSPEEQSKLARLGNQNLRVVVYSCITGKYDKLQAPFIKPNNVDYILYSDENRDNFFEVRKIPEYLIGKYSNSLINRYIKFHPHELFGDKYDYAIYLDGNITPVTDLSVLCEQINNSYGIAFHSHCSRNCIYEEVKACIALKKGNKKNLLKQIKKYRKEGFPSEYGMVEGNVIVSDLKNENAKMLLESCWNELLKSESGRDQLAWPYVFWKNNIKLEEVCNLGKNVYRNPKIRITRHK